ncbi:hypothetical protein C8J33_12236 [Rhizobium sp. PP-CC-3G-465]|nr:hypothetical protein C8J33_12236 [Rhizobium sp. PP-CC-3G-465]
MTTIRKGVEAAFDRFEALGPPTDYSADLGRLVQGLAVVGERLKAIEASPILKNGPEHYARALERSGESLVKSAAQQLERQAADLERAGNRLATYTKSAYDRRSQDIRMWTAGGFGLVLGIFLMLILPRFLPYSADSHVASLVMGRDRVSAGRGMIEAADPKQAEDISTGGWVYETNREVLDKCISDMFKTRKEQRCALILPVVEGRSGQ